MDGSHKSGLEKDLYIVQQPSQSIEKNSKTHNHKRNNRNKTKTQTKQKTHPNKTAKQNGKWSAVQSGD